MPPLCGARSKGCLAAGARQLEAVVLDNPAIGNLEELADVYLDEKQFAKARGL